MRLPWIHGGPDKALYVYPEEHYAAWLAELGEAGLGDRCFGENWLIRGAREADVRIGDIWELAGARFEVSRIRTPCVTLEAYFGGRQHMVRRMTANGRCGWYLRVLEPGLACTSGTIRVVRRNMMGQTVAEAFALWKMRTPASQ